MSNEWEQRAAAAEAAVLTRHLRRVWGVPGTALGVVGWPSAPDERVFGRWHYWWQAHLLDCLIDAWIRDPTPARRTRVRQCVRSQLLRNAGRWTNDYFDDMAWLGLALGRARAAGIVRADRPIRVLTAAVLAGWSTEQGSVPWRRGDEFRNAPANGPVAILLARSGRLDQASQTADWMRRELHDAQTGLVLDGWHPERPMVRDLYTYCQGVVIGAETELAYRTVGPVADDHRARVINLIGAVAQHLTSAGVLVGHGAGNAGLFTGILTRYLGLAVRRLPGDDAVSVAARRQAAELVIESAAALWRHRADVDGLPLFGPTWTATATVPTSRAARRRTADGAESSPQPERDLSVQLGGWMLLESAARIHRASATG